MYGKFIKNTAGYEINTLNLPTNWEYIYENRDVLLKVDQFGPVYAQAYPPGGIMLFKRENREKYSPWTILINDDFSNFFRPNLKENGAEPEGLKIKFLPECAIYSFTYHGLLCKTEIAIPKKGTTVIMRFKVKNVSAEKRMINLKSHMVPYLNEAVMPPWDKPEWYLNTGCEKGDHLVFISDVLNADGKDRKCGKFFTNKESLSGYELSYEKYIGQGSLARPDGKTTDEERIYGYPPIYAAVYDWELGAGEEKQLTQVMTLDDKKDASKYFENSCFDGIIEERKAEFAKLFSKMYVKSDDEAFDDYINYWVPLQMRWVASLDRGWPTGMRGSRDSANDYTALLYTESKNCREIILTMLECQRTDGWFPRQYSASGKHGKHDLRTHVDGGVFFMEFIWKYLAHTKDFAILSEETEWLDSNRKDTVLNHVIRCAEYYIAPENIGEHGLCKIRGGDWLDAVNTAGLEGRGESVTVSAQTVMAMKYLVDILKKTDENADVSKYLEAAEKLKENINKHAFNRQGFYNGVFNDNGLWVFSDRDPDGESRMYSVSNSYAVIAGVCDASKYEKLLSNYDTLKSDMGYRLFAPCLGKKPFDKAGRMASGDAPEYFAENGNVYNHGSQGFFARALATMREGDRLYDVIQWLLPYDTYRHPTELTYTPPYAIVNCWQNIPGFEHRSLMCFLTGSVAMAVRSVYEWMLGITPTLDGLEINPCLPEKMKEVEAGFAYLGKKHVLKISCGKIYIDGCEVTEKDKNLITDKEVFFIKI